LGTIPTQFDPSSRLKNSDKLPSPCIQSFLVFARRTIFTQLFRSRSCEIS
jgi:hypothetical protein